MRRLGITFGAQDVFLRAKRSGLGDRCWLLFCWAGGDGPVWAHVSYAEFFCFQTAFRLRWSNHGFNSSAHVQMCFRAAADAVS